MPGDFGTIRAAAKAAQPGDRILVGPGTYAESITIREPDLTIVGDGATLRQRGRRPALKVKADNVTVEGLDFDGAAVVVRGGSFTLRDAELAGYRGRVPVDIRGDEATIENVSVSNVHLARRQRAAMRIRSSFARVSNVSSQQIFGHSTARRGVFAMIELDSYAPVVEDCDLQVRLGACLALSAREFTVTRCQLRVEGRLDDPVFAARNHRTRNISRGAVISAQRSGNRGAKVTDNTISHSAFRACEILGDEVTISGNTMVGTEGAAGAILAEGHRVRVIDNTLEGPANSSLRRNMDVLVTVEGQSVYVGDNVMRAGEDQYLACSARGDRILFERNLIEGEDITGLQGIGDSWLVRESVFRVSTVQAFSTAVDFDGDGSRFFDNTIDVLSGDAGASEGLSVRGDRNDVARNTISRCFGTSHGAAIRANGDFNTITENLMTDCRGRVLVISGDRNSASGNSVLGLGSFSPSADTHKAVNISGELNVVTDTDVVGEFDIGVELVGAQNRVSDARIAVADGLGLRVLYGLNNLFTECDVTTDSGLAVSIEDGAATELRDSTITTCGEFGIANRAPSTSLVNVHVEAAGADPIDNTGSFNEFENVTTSQRTDCED